MKKILSEQKIKRFQQLAGIKSLYEDNGPDDIELYDEEGRKIVYNYLDEADNLTKDEVENRLEKLNTDIAKLDPIEVTKALYDSGYTTKEIVVAYAELTKTALMIVPNIGVGMASVTDTKAKAGIIRALFTNKIMIIVFALLGIDKEFRYETVEKILKPETPNIFNRIIQKVYSFVDKGYDPDAPQVIHERIYDDGTVFFIIAGGLLIAHLLLSARIKYAKETSSGFSQWLQKMIGLREEELSDSELKDLENIDLPNYDVSIDENDIIYFAKDLISSFTEELKEAGDEALSGTIAQAAE